MTIPAFNIHGVIPPFTGADPVAGGPAALSPYVVKPVEVVDDLGTTADRRDILTKWLDHRRQLRLLGFTGFQWLDGSFVEKKNPQDLDVVTFLRRPLTAQSPVALGTLLGQNPGTFNRAMLKASHRLDAYFVDMDGASETIVEVTRYFCGLFSHRRNDYLWKGMLRVDLSAAAADDDVAAAALLVSALLIGHGGAGP
jgi:hypothetical protein